MTDEVDPYDLEAQDRKKATKAELDRFEVQREEEDIVWLMRNKQGRRILARIIHQSGADGPLFSTNALMMSRLIGARDVGADLRALAKRLCPEVYPTLEREWMNDRIATDEAARTAKQRQG